MRPETFRHEIYSAASDSPGQLDFTALVAHDAHVKTSDHKQAQEASGEDTALAALKQSLASMAKEKEARKYVTDNIAGTCLVILLSHANHFLTIGLPSAIPSSQTRRMARCRPTVNPIHFSTAHLLPRL